MKYQFSIIVPTYNRQLALNRCLRSLLRQAYPPDQFEVIVVDDGSVHPVILDPDLFVGGFAVSLMRIPNSGPGPARNAGVAVAKGQFLAFTDDDCQPDPLWLLELERNLSVDSCRIVGGKTLNMLRRNPCSSTSQLIVDMAYAYYNEVPDSARFFATNNLAVRADLFARTGGFRGGAFRIASEDREFCDRWRQRGLKLRFAPDAIVYHAHHLDLGSFCRQHFRYGRGAMRYHQIRQRRGSGGLIDDLGFHSRLIPAICRHLKGKSGVDRLTVIGLLLLWQSCNLVGFIYEFAHAAVEQPIAEQ